MPVENPRPSDTVKRDLPNSPVDDKNRKHEDGETKETSAELSPEALQKSLKDIERALDEGKKEQIDHALKQLGSMLKGIDFSTDAAQKNLLPILQAWGHYQEGKGMMFIALATDYTQRNNGEFVIKPVLSDDTVVLKQIFDHTKGDISLDRKRLPLGKIGEIVDVIVHQAGLPPENSFEHVQELNTIIRNAEPKDRATLIAFADQCFGEWYKFLDWDDSQEQWQVSYVKNENRFDFVTYNKDKGTFERRHMSPDGDGPAAEGVLAVINDLPAVQEPARTPTHVDPEEEQPDPPEPPKTVRPPTEVSPDDDPVEEPSAQPPSDSRRKAEEPASAVPPDDDETPKKADVPDEATPEEKQAYDITLKDTDAALDGRIRLLKDQERQYREFLANPNFADGADAVLKLGGLFGPTTRDSVRKLLNQVVASRQFEEINQHILHARLAKVEGGTNEKMKVLRSFRTEVGLTELPGPALTILNVPNGEFDRIMNDPLRQWGPDYASIIREIGESEKLLEQYQDILQKIDTGIGLAAGLIPGGALVYSLSRNLSDVATGMKTPQGAAFDFALELLASKLAGKAVAQTKLNKVAEKWASENAKYFTRQAATLIEGVVGNKIVGGIKDNI